MNDKQKSKEVYVYFFKVYSEGKNTIKLSEAIGEIYINLFRYMGMVSFGEIP